MGLFETSENITRTDWRAYVTALDIDRHFARVQAIGFSQRIPAAEKQRHEDGVRQEGFPEYRTKPEAPRGEYYSVIYLEPFSARNMRSFGYDMMTEPVRRAAQELARDSGRPALSGKITLVSETDQDIKAGFIMYLPVYRHGAPTGTVDERREVILGFVFSQFRANNLMRGIMGNDQADINFQIFDGPATTDAALLYDSRAAYGNVAASQPPAYQSLRQIDIAGRIWTLAFASAPRLEAATADRMPAVVAAGGLGVDLVLHYVIFASSRLRKRAEHLAEQHAATLDRTVKLGMITDNIPMLIAYIDRDQRYRFTNAAFHLKYGGDAVTTVGRILHEILPDEIFTPTQSYVQRALAGETVFYDRCEPSGRVSEATYLPQRDARGAVVGFYAIVTDITERKRIEDALSEQARVLAQANIDIEQFAYIASHDLKAPLRGIGLLAEWITEELGDTAPANVARNLARLRRRALRMGALMESLLAYSRVGRVASNAQEVNTAELVATIADDLATRPGFVIESVAPLPILLTALAPLDTVLRNLVANAIEHHDRDAGRVVVSAVRHDAFVAFRVADDGPGIALADRERAFRMFETLAPKTDGSGSGIGLALVKRLVDQAGGQIQIIESNAARGVIFEFTWPFNWQK